MAEAFSDTSSYEREPHPGCVLHASGVLVCGGRTGDTHALSALHSEIRSVDMDFLEDVFLRTFSPSRTSPQQKGYPFDTSATPGLNWRQVENAAVRPHAHAVNIVSCGRSDAAFLAGALMFCALGPQCVFREPALEGRTFYGLPRDPGFINGPRAMFFSRGGFRGVFFRVHIVRL
jgi:hypothetical protein